MLDLFEELSSRGKISINEELDVQPPAKLGIEFNYEDNIFEAFVIEKDGNEELRIYPFRGLACVDKKRTDEINSASELENRIESASSFNLVTDRYV